MKNGKPEKRTPEEVRVSRFRNLSYVAKLVKTVGKSYLTRKRKTK